MPSAKETWWLLQSHWVTLIQNNRPPILHPILIKLFILAFYILALVNMLQYISNCKRDNPSDLTNAGYFTHFRVSKVMDGDRH